VIYIDELMATITRGAALRWEPLQSELYDITNGGEHFYVLLDEHLRKSETDPIVFQMFYFCLSDGFVGMAESDPRKIEQYKALLLARIPLELPAEMPAARKPEQPIELVSFPWQPYAWSAAAIALGWMLFRVLAEFS
jgi:type VI protein secretion system component VasF